MALVAARGKWSPTIRFPRQSVGRPELRSRKYSQPRSHRPQAPVPPAQLDRPVAGSRNRSLTPLAAHIRSAGASSKLKIRCSNPCRGPAAEAQTRYVDLRAMSKRFRPTSRRSISSPPEAGYAQRRRSSMRLAQLADVEQIRTAQLGSNSSSFYELMKTLFTALPNWLARHMALA